MSGETRLRAARPTVEDGLVYARYLDQVSEGFFTMRLGRRAPEIVAAAFPQPAHDLSWENVTLVERGGSVVGMVAGFSSERQRTFTERPLREAAGGWALRVRLTGILFWPMLRMLETIPDGDFYLQTMIIDEELRGTGVGSRLLEHVEERARAAGSARISLDVADNNTGARRLYERRGWTVEARWPGLPLVPPVFHRMARPLA